MSDHNSANNQSKMLLTKLVVSYLTIISLAIFFLTATYFVAIKNYDLEKNINQSIKTLESEGTYPSFGFSPRKIILDNFTDALMLNIGYSVDSKWSDFAIFNKRYVVFGDDTDQLVNLKSEYERKYDFRLSYERYWHGYLIYLRPLLLIASYNDIRQILSFILFWTFFLTINELAKKRWYSKMVAVIVAAFSVDIIYLGNSIQFSQVFIIGFIASLFYLANNKTNVYLLLFNVGMITAFFDLLTAPLVTLGLLLIVTSYREDFSLLIKKIFFWLGGYSIFWASKWVIVELLFEKGVVMRAINQIMIRTIEKSDSNYSQLRAIKLNFDQLVDYGDLGKAPLFLIISILLLLIIIFRKRKLDRKKLIYWFSMMLLPYIWYAVLGNHSYVHKWFTYRTQFMTIAGGLMCFFGLIDKRKAKSFLKKITFKRNKKRFKEVH
ncbi:MAG: hypothetical protein ACOZAN_01705 [Patescibacteria group bacterium]